MQAYINVKQHSNILSNYFLSREDTAVLLKDKECRAHFSPDALLLLVPRHNAYYDCVFMARDACSLRAALRTLPSLTSARVPVRAAIVGKEPQASELANLFKEFSFTELKKLLRMRLAPIPDNVLAAMRRLAEPFLNDVSVAKPEDAEEVLEILTENFDTIGENLPELGDIAKTIANGHCIVLRRDGCIASLHYFSIVNNIFYGYYDVTRKEYRKLGGLFQAISVYEMDVYFKECHVNRLIGWREAKRRKLIKASRQSNSFPDGVVIYNMLWTPGDERNAPAEAHP